MWLLATVLDSIGLGEKLNRKQAIEQWECYDREMQCYGSMEENISTNLCRTRKNLLEEVTLQLRSQKDELALATGKDTGWGL